MFKGQVPPSANTTSQESKKYNQPRKKKSNQPEIGNQSKHTNAKENPRTDIIVKVKPVKKRTVSDIA